MVVVHTPTRPTWHCVADGEPWPCPDARVNLRSEYADDPGALAACMSTLLMTATGDVANAYAPPPDLFNRFMAWTDPTPDR